MATQKATPMADASFAADGVPAQSREDRDNVSESLIEEISIDGMCGVY